MQPQKNPIMSLVADLLIESVQSRDIPESLQYLRKDPYYPIDLGDERNRLSKKSTEDQKVILVDTSANLMLWRTNGFYPEDNTWKIRLMSWFGSQLLNFLRRLNGIGRLPHPIPMTLNRVCTFDASRAELKLRAMYPVKS